MPAILRGPPGPAGPTGVGSTGATGATCATGASFNSCAVLGDGSPECWGYDGNGQLGEGDHFNQNVPMTVPGLVAKTD